MKSNPTFRQQHKLYEQSRRTQIANLISTLYQCLPREYKPIKDTHMDTLSSVLNYVQFLQKTATENEASVINENTKIELEKLRTHVTDLERRCENYAKHLDGTGATKVKSSSGDACSTISSSRSWSDADQLKLPLSGPVSVIAASAPLVFLINQQSSVQSTKTFANASTSPDDSALTFQDASTPTVTSTTDASTETSAPKMLNMATQFEMLDYSDRACSPITINAAMESTKKRPATTAATLSDQHLSIDSSDKNKRRRSDETMPSISEIVDLVAAHGTAGQDRIGRHDLANVESLESTASSAVVCTSVTATSAAYPILASTTAATSWNNCQLPTLSHVPLVASILPQNRQSHHDQHLQQKQQQQQQPQLLAPRHQQPPGTRSYQSNTTDAIQRNFAVPESGRLDDNCNKRTSRRGVNFSVEFLHGNTSDRLMRQPVPDGQQRQNSRSTSTHHPYRPEIHEQTPYSLVNYGYYDQHGNYSNSSGQFATTEPSWPDATAYNWWNNQTPTMGFGSSVCQTRQPDSSIITPNNAKSTGGSQANSSARANRDDQAVCINLSNSLFDGGSTTAEQPTSGVSSWSVGAHSSYANSRFGYSSTSTFFPEPPNFNYTRLNANSSRKSTSNSTASTTSITTISSSPAHSYYWPANDWTSSTFSSNAIASVSGFGSNDSSSSQQQGKAPTFQIATMFPEASLSASNSTGASNWRPAENYQRQEHRNSTGMIGNVRMTTTAASDYFIQPPNYTQAVDNSCNNGSRF